MLENLAKTGRIFYGIAMAGMGLQQFIYPGFRPVFIPQWPADMPPLSIWVYIVGLLLVLAGLAIIFNKHARIVSLYLGGFLLFLFLFFHLPFRLLNNPGIVGAWTDNLKLLALAGGAFIVVGSLPKPGVPGHYTSSLTKLLEKIIPAGRIFVAIMMIVFGIDHFLYADFVKTLVPTWIPGNLFWTYFAAVALIGSGLAILFNIWMRPAAFLLGLMIFIWFLVLHIPRGILYPNMNNGNEITSVFQSLGFSGIAFLIALEKSKIKSKKA